MRRDLDDYVRDGAVLGLALCIGSIGLSVTLLILQGIWEGILS